MSDNYDLRAILSTQPLTPNEFDGNVAFSIKVMTPLESSTYRQSNPYHIVDGQWGGFAPQTWFTFKQFGRTVFEADRYNRVWLRVWDDVEQQWRAPTAEESAVGFPFPEQRPINIKFDKIATPVFLKDITAVQNYNPYENQPTNLRRGINPPVETEPSM